MWRVGVRAELDGGYGETGGEGYVTHSHGGESV